MHIFFKWRKRSFCRTTMFDMSTNIDISSIVNCPANECPSRCFATGWLYTPHITFSIQLLWVSNFWPFNLKGHCIFLYESFLILVVFLLIYFLILSTSFTTKKDHWLLPPWPTSNLLMTTIILFLFLTLRVHWITASNLEYLDRQKSHVS